MITINGDSIRGNGADMTIVLTGNQQGELKIVNSKVGSESAIVMDGAATIESTDVRLKTLNGGNAPISEFGGIQALALLDAPTTNDISPGCVKPFIVAGVPGWYYHNQDTNSVELF